MSTYFVSLFETFNDLKQLCQTISQCLNKYVALKEF